jgi:CDP-diacylglycerol--glycerol-3-phosphate 3-phosphatidyltransferase
LTKDQTHPRTLTDIVRWWTRNLLLPVGRFLHARGVHPDAITLAGFLLVIVAGILIAREMLFVSGILLLLGLPLDALDGTVARMRDDIGQRPFGGFLDSTLDRYADGVLFSALAFYGKQVGSDTIIILAMVALVGAFMVSYTRARAEGLGLECKVGVFTRMERVFAILVLLFTGWVLPLLWVLAIGTQLTTIQRIWYVRQISKPGVK